MRGQLIRHRPGIDPKPPGKTDWARIDRLNEPEIEAAALADPDAQPLTDAQLAQGFRPRALRALRERLGLTQSAFAARFRIDLETLQAWEAGHSVPAAIECAYLKVIERNPEAVLAALDD